LLRLWRARLRCAQAGGERSRYVIRKVYDDTSQLVAWAPNGSESAAKGSPAN
jgi:hypothetical protein